MSQLKRKALAQGTLTLNTSLGLRNAHNASPCVSSQENKRSPDETSSVKKSLRGAFDDARGDPYSAYSQHHGDLSFSSTSPQEVLVVDARGTKLSPDATEVKVDLRYQDSPAKVVCHSPRVVFSDLRNTGQTGLAAQVNVDTVPSLSLIQQSASFSEKRLSRGSPSKRTPTVIREIDQRATAGGSPHLGSPQLPRDRSGQLDRGSPIGKLDMGSPTAKLDLGSPTTRLDRGSPPLGLEASSKNLEYECHTVEFRTEDVSGERLKDSLTSDANHINREEKTKFAQPQTKGAIKKKAGIAVPSKFRTAMTGTANTSRSMAGTANTSRSLATRPGGRSQQESYQAMLQSSRGRPQRSAGQSIRQHSLERTAQHSQKTGNTSLRGSARKPYQRVVSGKPDNMVGKQRAPVLKSALKSDLASLKPTNVAGQLKKGPKIAQAKEKTSTPVGGAAAVEETLGFDSSIIPGNRSHMYQDDASMNFENINFTQFSQPERPAGTQRSEKVKAPADITQRDLDVLYGRYLQWVFLDSKKKKTFADEEKEVMNSLGNLSEEIERLNRRCLELETDLMETQHAATLDQMLHVQMANVSAVTQHLPTLEQQYGEMAAGLLSTQHELPTNDVWLPPTAKDLDQYQRDIESSLKETEQLLGEVSLLTRSESDHASQFAKTSLILKNTVEEEANQLNRCETLSKAAQCLVTHQTSLICQQLDERRA